MKVLILAGGTGGHVYPALSVAKEFKRNQHSISWIGKKTSLESKLSKDESFNFISLDTKGFKGKNIFRKVLSLIYLEINIVKSIFIINKIKPDIVFSTGGYVTLAPAIASYLLFIPLFIHEQNSIPGLVNKILNKLSRLTFEAFPNSFNKSSKICTVGNPVRSEIVKSPPSQPDIKEFFNILILGGSQGSKQLNEIVIKSFEGKVIPSHWHIVHQIGDLEKSSIIKAYSKLDCSFEVVTYIEDMGRAYHESDLVIGRSGAMTISEICCSSRPSILFPLPWAADNHQYFNAKFLEERKASIVLDSSLSSADNLFALLNDLEKDHNARHSMSLNAFDAFPVSSASKIVEIINESF
ncbi:MAG: undecaprenyldiphospho-muramoylpentapeptide beta-N-acetylglucosaminyltransferase [Candidatus Marinimicrobia bacterium]|nr:undecaprenyldiphospho-muramoylpentapeptide beta-N-acetylglucosaminyltransferase [Candidatus Neomarinimicrobiota bacterium]|tara:strand:- start:4549 stop:5607 length:1059 start_codon:yes stop_codon:yes gene_type:complete